jgi:hypothetical protein
MSLSISSDDYQVSNVFSDVDTFAFDIEFDSPLSAGAYVNPDIISVSYSVSGTLVAGTPSGFTSFALQRDITGTEFYAQGSSLSFEIGAGAALVDGVQVAELVGNNIVLTFNGRENGNGRFHPALLELNMDGTGRIQNSDNIIVDNPLDQIGFGEEYITDLMFDAGNTTVLIATPAAQPPPPPSSSGGGAISWLAIFALLLVARGRRAFAHFKFFCSRPAKTPPLVPNVNN